MSSPEVKLVRMGCAPTPSARRKAVIAWSVTLPPPLETPALASALRTKSARHDSERQPDRERCRVSQERRIQLPGQAEECRWPAEYKPGQLAEQKPCGRQTVAMFSGSATSSATTMPVAATLVL